MIFLWIFILSVLSNELSINNYIN